MANEFTLPADFVVYNAQTTTGYWERVQDNIKLFNKNSLGTILLESAYSKGYFLKDSFLKPDLTIKDRNITVMTDKETKKLGSGEKVRPIHAWKGDPQSWTYEALRAGDYDMNEIAYVMGQELADQQMIHWGKIAIGTLAAAISSNPSMVVAASIATDGKKVFTKALRKFGDALDRVKLFAMNSDIAMDFVDKSIDTPATSEYGIVIYGGSPGTLGRPILVSDTITGDRVLGLTDGACVVSENGAPRVEYSRLDLKENMGVKMESEGSVYVDVKGYSWNNATPNPTLAALAAAANWTKISKSDKVTAGVLINLT